MAGSAIPFVVVGTDGSDASAHAIRYGVAEAGRLGTGVRLVHVSPDYTPTTPMLPLIRDDFEQVGHRILREGVDVVHAVDPGCEVATARRTGPTVATLLDLAAESHLVVLGRDRHSRLESVFTGSTTVGIAGRSRCPMVSVPPAWEPGHERGRVVAGVRSPLHATELLARAFGVAEARGARLVVLRAWQLPGPYDEVVEARSHPGEQVREIEDEIDPLLERHRLEHPTVEVELSVVHQQPARALLHAAGTADVLVLVRRAHGLPFTAHLGGTARTLLREAPCPVEVVPPREVLAEMRGSVLERAGAVQPGAVQPGAVRPRVLGSEA